VEPFNFQLPMTRRSRIKLRLLFHSRQHSKYSLTYLSVSGRNITRVKKNLQAKSAASDARL